FMQDKRLSAADIGTAVHAVMQHISFEEKMGSAEIRSFIDTLVGRELLSPDEAKAIRVKDVEALYESEIAERLSNAVNIKREVPFTYAKKDEEGDSQIVQGIIDCLFEEEDGWVLLDYKTDRVSQISDVPKEMSARYEIQLSVYQEAVEAILKIPIKERLLYLFSSGEEVKI